MILIVIFTISHFWSPKNFLLVCICILIFHGIYPLPLYPLNFFSCFVARDWEDFKFLGDLLRWGPNFLFEIGGRAIFFHKAIIDQSWKLKKNWWQNYLLHMCMLIFHIFNWEFSLWEFSFCSSAHWNFQKSVYCCLVIALWNCEYWLIRAPNKSIFFGSNSEINHISNIILIFVFTAAWVEWIFMNDFQVFLFLAQLLLTYLSLKSNQFITSK